MSCGWSRTVTCTMVSCVCRHVSDAACASLVPRHFEHKMKSYKRDQLMSNGRVRGSSPPSCVLSDIRLNFELVPLALHSPTQLESDVSTSSPYIPPDSMCRARERCLYNETRRRMRTRGKHAAPSVRHQQQARAIISHSRIA